MSTENENEEQKRERANKSALTRSKTVVEQLSPRLRRSQSHPFLHFKDTEFHFSMTTGKEIPKEYCEALKKNHKHLIRKLRKAI